MVVVELPPVIEVRFVSGTVVGLVVGLVEEVVSWLPVFVVTEVGVV